MSLPLDGLEICSRIHAHMSVCARARVRVHVRVRMHVRVRPRAQLSARARARRQLRTRVLAPFCTGDWPAPAPVGGWGGRWMGTCGRACVRGWVDGPYLVGW